MRKSNVLLALVTLVLAFTVVVFGSKALGKHNKFRTHKIWGIQAKQNGSKQIASDSLNNQPLDNRLNKLQVQETFDPPKNLTFNKDIAPIVFNNCSTCHHPGEVAPFDLLTYSDVKKRDKMIAAVTQTRYMPPWKAEHGFGEFKGERYLSQKEIATIKAWVEQGSKEGDPKDLPPTPKFTSDWKLGQPDLVLTMPQAYTVPAEGQDIYRNIVIPTNLPQDTYIRAIEYKASNRRVVHHAILFLDSRGVAKKLDAKDEQMGYPGFGGPGFVPSGGLGGWAPGMLPEEMPPGVVRLIPKNSDLVIQTHFHPSGKVEQEQSSVGLYFSKVPPKKLILPVVLINRSIDIPAGSKDYAVEDSFTLPIDIEVITLVPHAHYIGKSIKGWADLPDGSSKPLINVNNWDFNWQTQYQLKEPLKLPKGTKLHMRTTYDNSSDNPRNPSVPPQRVTWGEETTNEMAIIFMGVVADKQEDLPKLRRAMMVKLLDWRVLSHMEPPQWLEILQRLVKPMDRNMIELPPRTNPLPAQSTQPTTTKPKPNPVAASPAVTDASFNNRPKHNSTLTYKDEFGKLHSSSEWKNNKATVLYFLGRDCPISNQYIPELKRISKEYSKQNIGFYVVLCDDDTTPAIAKTHRQNFKYTNSVIIDSEHTLSRQTGTSITPEVSVIAPDNHILYQGRIDDLYTNLGQARHQAQSHDLRQALDEIIAGKVVSSPKTQAIGCYI